MLLTTIKKDDYIMNNNYVKLQLKDFSVSEVAKVTGLVTEQFQNKSQKRSKTIAYFKELTKSLCKELSELKFIDDEIVFIKDVKNSYKSLNMIYTIEGVGFSTELLNLEYLGSEKDYIKANLKLILSNIMDSYIIVRTLKECNTLRSQRLHTLYNSNIKSNLLDYILESKKEQVEETLKDMIDVSREAIDEFYNGNLNEIGLVNAMSYNKELFGELFESDIELDGRKVSVGKGDNKLISSVSYTEGRATRVSTLSDPVYSGTNPLIEVSNVMDNKYDLYIENVGNVTLTNDEIRERPFRTKFINSISNYELSEKLLFETLIGMTGIDTYPMVSRILNYSSSRINFYGSSSKYTTSKVTNNHYLYGDVKNLRNQHFVLIKAGNNFVKSSLHVQETMVNNILIHNAKNNEDFYNDDFNLLDAIKFLISENNLSNEYNNEFLEDLKISYKYRNKLSSDIKYIQKSETTIKHFIARIKNLFSNDDLIILEKFIKTLIERDNNNITLYIKNKDDKGEVQIDESYFKFMENKKEINKNPIDEIKEEIDSLDEEDKDEVFSPIDIQNENEVTEIEEEKVINENKEVERSHKGGYYILDTSNDYTIIQENKNIFVTIEFIYRSEINTIDKVTKSQLNNNEVIKRKLFIEKLVTENEKYGIKNAMFIDNLKLKVINDEGYSIIINDYRSIITEEESIESLFTNHMKTIKLKKLISTLLDTNEDDITINTDNMTYKTNESDVFELIDNLLI